MFRELIERAGMTAYPIGALVVFVVVFILVAGRALLRAADDSSAAAALPLRGDNEGDGHVGFH
jgi:hypothetical protein